MTTPSIPIEMKRRLTFGAFGLFVMVLGIGVTVLLTQNQQSVRTQAGPQEKPQEVAITNLTENSLSVSWITDADILGSVAYGTTQTALNQVALEDNNPLNKASSSHHVTIRPLAPATTYYFEIISGDNTYGNGAKPYTITTPELLGTPPPPKTVYGSVLTDDGAPFDGRAYVIVDIPGHLPMSAVVNPLNGNWSVSVSTSRSEDLSTYAEISSQTPLSITIQAGSEGKAEASTTFLSAQPVAPMTLSKTPRRSSTLKDFLPF